MFHCFLNLLIDTIFFALTDHRPQPVPPSQSECESFGPQGPPAPSDTSGCCCSCWGNQGRQSGLRWHSSSVRRRKLTGNKEMQSFTGMRRSVALVLCQFYCYVNSIVILLCVSVLCTVRFHYLFVSCYVYVYVMYVCCIYSSQGNCRRLKWPNSHVLPHISSLGVKMNGVFCVYGPW